MGTPREPKPAKFFVAPLAADAALLSDVEKNLVAILGVIDDHSKIVPWTASKFYEAEDGRRFVSFSPQLTPDRLAAIKLQTQQIEDRYREPVADGRRINLDSGYLDDFKVALASTKNASQRIYLGSGIYAEAMLHYYDGGFHGLPYTYRDYLRPETIAFLTRLRST
jgi:hypothetical protein